MEIVAPRSALERTVSRVSEDASDARPYHMLPPRIQSYVIDHDLRCVPRSNIGPTRLRPITSSGSEELRALCPRSADFTISRIGATFRFHIPSRYARGCIHMYTYRRYVRQKYDKRSTFADTEDNDLFKQPSRLRIKDVAPVCQKFRTKYRFTFTWKTRIRSRPKLCPRDKRMRPAAGTQHGEKARALLRPTISKNDATIPGNHTDTHVPFCNSMPSRRGRPVQLVNSPRVSRASNYVQLRGHFDGTLRPIVRDAYVLHRLAYNCSNIQGNCTQAC